MSCRFSLTGCCVQKLIVYYFFLCVDTGTSLQHQQTYDFFLGFCNCRQTIKKLQKVTILMAVFVGLTAAAEPYIFILKKQKKYYTFYVRFWYLVVIALFIFWSKIFLVEQIIMMLDARFMQKISICA